VGVVRRCRCQSDCWPVVPFENARHGISLDALGLRGNHVGTVEQVDVEHILADVTTQCPGVHSLLIRVHRAVSPIMRGQHFPRLLELVSNSALTRLDIDDGNEKNPRLNTVLSPEQEEQIDVMTERNRVIPAYLQTTHLLKQRGPVAYAYYEDPPIIVVYADDGEDRPKHQFVLSHALCQAAVHPVFFSHFYEFVRNHADQLPGERQGSRRPAPAAAAQPLALTTMTTTTMTTTTTTGPACIF
jgi:hypothetical protein